MVFRITSMAMHNFRIPFGAQTLPKYKIFKETNRNNENVNNERSRWLVLRSSFHVNSIANKVFEPDYLDSAGLVPPIYPPINVQVKGYDFEILESFQSYIHNLAENMGLDVSDAWATPATSWNAYTYDAESTIVKETYKLHLYERNIQIVNVQTTELPVLVDIVRKTLPEGVTLSIHEHKAEHKEARFISDPFIDGLRTELHELESKKQEAIDKAIAEKTAKGKK